MINKSKKRKKEEKGGAWLLFSQLNETKPKILQSWQLSVLSGAGPSLEIAFSTQETNKLPIKKGHSGIVASLSLNAHITEGI